MVSMFEESHSLESVKDYYGKVLQTNKDLKTSACCAAESMPLYLREILKEIDNEVKDKFYGCGSPFPNALEGCTVLDLGSGSGRDCFLLSKLVGPRGRVIGVDMTTEQIEVAKRHRDQQMKVFGFEQPNVEFIQGYIEDLESAGIESQSVDVVVSNCVVNLSPAKDRVFKEIFRVLKTGGELYFSDVFANRRVPQDLRLDPVFVGECLGGALYKEDFRRLLNQLGCNDYRQITSSPIQLMNPEIKQRAGLLQFSSITYRAFKLELEDRCEDYGQTATYLGGIKESPNVFALDDHHVFEKEKPMLVCGNTAKMLTDSRYGQFFRVTGDKCSHFGLFDCEPSAASAQLGSCC